MAIVKYSSLVDDISGKVGGVVFASGPGGPVVRQKVTPSNPKTARQIAARNALSACGAAWAALTSSVRDQWQDYAASTPVLGHYGKEVYLSGFDMFCRMFTLATFAGSAVPATGPSTPGLAAGSGITAVAQTAASAAMSFTFGSGATWKSINGTAAIAHVAESQSPTRRTLQSPFRALLLAKGNNSTPPTSPIAATNPWGTIAAGRVVYVSIHILGADGRLSPKETFVVTAA